MNTIRLAAVGLVALASFTFTGCGDTRAEYDQTLITEYERRITELENQLAKSESDKARVIIREEKPGQNNNAPAAGPNVGYGTDNLVQVFTVDSNVLFRPGSAELSATAKASLARVVAIIKEKYPNHYVRVDGHTDNQSITRSKDKWDDNWDLAGGRAQKVLHYLIERGLPNADLGFAGFADHRPVASNASEATRQKNRRVEIRVIPKDGGKDSK